MIKDSGERREFETGAVRDMAKGKGRFDLMPLMEMSELFSHDARLCNIIRDLGCMLNSDEDDACVFTTNAIYYFIAYCLNKNYTDVSLGDVAAYMGEVAIHFEEGAEKYGEDNWKKGLPRSSYIDSATRHLMKYVAGLTDERHDRAFIWNCLAYLWTVRHLF